ncbi:MAG: heme exporter protein CcmD [Gammaproteobacteria bacterium]|nr:heme exporter protein CcmD [Gammaproteobacteria bacterium]
MNIEWIHGPHSHYIMIAYGISALIVLYCALQPVLRRRALLRHIRVQQRAEKISRQ